MLLIEQILETLNLEWIIWPSNKSPILPEEILSCKKWPALETQEIVQQVTQWSKEKSCHYSIPENLNVTLSNKTLSLVLFKIQANNQDHWIGINTDRLNNNDLKQLSKSLYQFANGLLNIQKSLEVKETKHLQNTINQKETSEGLHILLVEDRLINQRATCRYLEKFGHQVKIANNGKEAVSQYQANTPFDVILMDVEMPEMNGYEATKVIRNIEQKDNKSHTPIIILSGFSITDTKETLVQKGLDGCMVKPMDLELMYHIIDTTQNNTAPSHKLRTV